jgi:hypothetical protein
METAYRAQPYRDDRRRDTPVTRSDDDHAEAGRRDGHDGGPSGVGGAGWAGLTWWELWGAAGGLWALLEGKTEIGGNCLTKLPRICWTWTPIVSASIGCMNSEQIISAWGPQQGGPVPTSRFVWPRADGDL